VEDFCGLSIVVKKNREIFALPNDTNGALGIGVEALRKG